MGKVIVNASMSVDGFVADENDGVSEIFGWYENGDVPFTTAREDMSFNLTPEDASYLTEFVDQLGALVVGRRLFDITNGWSGMHPLGVPVVVVTHERPDAWIAAHPDAAFTFITDGGVAAAVQLAKKIAGETTVAVAAGNLGSQVLNAGLADGIAIDLVPVALGSGKPFFDQITAGPIRLSEPRIVPGTGALHLLYDIQDHSAAQAKNLPSG